MKLLEAIIAANHRALKGDKSADRIVQAEDVIYIAHGRDVRHIGLAALEREIGGE